MSGTKPKWKHDALHQLKLKYKYKDKSELYKGIVAWTVLSESLMNVEFEQRSFDQARNW